MAHVAARAVLAALYRQVAGRQAPFAFDDGVADGGSDRNLKAFCDWGCAAAAPMERWSSATFVQQQIRVASDDLFEDMPGLLSDDSSEEEA